MRLLLDTHIAVWMVSEPEKMPARARDLLLDPNNQAFGSTVAVWEVAIKRAKRMAEGRAELVPPSVLLDRLIEAGLEVLPVTAHHACELDGLPLHHADPFDRLLVAQAKAEPMRLLTADRAVAAYGETVLLV